MAKNDSSDLIIPILPSQTGSMNQASIPGLLSSMRNYYESGATKPYAFRIASLRSLKSAVTQYEKEIAAALYADLKKSPEESFGTETGLVLADINVALKNLRHWMQPVSVGTNMVNITSSGTIYREPRGVTLIIAPWNYPFQLALMPLVGAIAGGNCAVVKPSEIAPATAALIEKMIKAIFPPEYIRCVNGDGASLVPGMMQSFRFDHIFYTGSISVGKSIYQQAAKDLIPVTLELGGKSPVVVESDANIAIAAKRIIFGKFNNAGQTCIAPDFLVVHESVKAQLVEALKATIVRFFGNDASHSESYGRIINKKRFDQLITYLDSGPILYGGDHDAPQLYIGPTLIDQPPLNAPVMQEEIFGPVLPIFSFKETPDALAIIKLHPNPLSFYVFTGNRKKQKEWIERVSFGGGCINDTITHFANDKLPFGGIGNSGIGAYHGRFSFDTFTHPKSVLKTPTWVDIPFKYPPLTGKMKLFKFFIR